MAEAKVRLTPAGLKKRQERLVLLKTVEVVKNNQAIKEAKEQGDLSENAEYDAAREKQRELEREISQLEYEIKHYELVNDKHIVLFDMKKNENLEIDLTTSSEAKVLDMKISEESIFGKNLANKKEGDLVRYECNGRSFEYRILSISYPEALD